MAREKLGDCKGAWDYGVHVTIAEAGNEISLPAGSPSKYR
jgi:hypothetical protein